VYTVRFSKLLLEIKEALFQIQGLPCTETLIRNLPKADIHVHLPGTISPQTAWHLGERHGFLSWKHSCWGDSRLLSPHNPHKKYSEIFVNFEELRYDSHPDLRLLHYHIVPQDFSSFDRIMATVQGHRFPPGGIQTEEDISLILQAYLHHCLEDNIFYTEVQQNIRLAHTIYPHLPPRKARERFYQLLAHFQQLFSQYDIILHFLNCFNKTQVSGLSTTSQERAIEAALWLKETQESFPGLFVGLQSAGLESCPGASPSLLSQGYYLAYEHGFGCEAHAGEGIGFQYLHDTLHELPVQRIAHGFQAIENLSTIQAIKESQITLVMSPVINLILGARIYHYHNNQKVGKTLIHHLDAHPIFHLLRDYGLNIALSSDNPHMGGVSLCTAMLLLAGIQPVNINTLYQLSIQAAQVSPLQLHELITLMIHAITSAYASEDIKLQFLTRLKEFISELIVSSKFSLR